jgi:hypothetical protein
MEPDVACACLTAAGDDVAAGELAAVPVCVLSAGTAMLIHITIRPG